MSKFGSYSIVTEHRALIQKKYVQEIWICSGQLCTQRLKLYQGPSGHAHLEPSWDKSIQPAWVLYLALQLIWQDRNVGMCLQHDLDHVCAHGWCRGAQTGKPESIHARRMLQWNRRISSLPLKHIGSIQQSSQSGLAHCIFPSQCLWEPEDTAFQEARQQQSAAENSWLSGISPSDLPAAGSAEYHSKAALSLAPVSSLLTLLYFRVNAVSQN